MPRIVSLIASATEIVCALGMRDSLVGCSHECDFPESVKTLPVCTEPKFPIEGSSYEIDQRVKAILQEGLSVYRVNAELLAELKPTVIVTQAHCEVCAVSLKDVEQAVCSWIESQPRIVSLCPNSLTDIWRDFQLVADALEIPQRGKDLVADCQRRMAKIAEKAKSIVHLPRVACIEWINPLMAAGNWMPELVELAGGLNLFGQAGGHSPWMSWPQLVEADSDVILILPCGWDTARTRQEMPELTSRAEWPSLKAVRSGQVYLLDGNAYFNRPGPRLVESLEILAEMLHPDHFSSGHQGRGWERWI